MSHKEKDSFQPVSQKVGGLLTVLWRKILEENNLKNKNIIEDKVKKAVMDMETDSSNINKLAKATLTNNVYAGEMSWRTFVDLLFRFLKVKKFTLSIKLTFPNGNESVHNLITRNIMETYEDEELK